MGENLHDLGGKGRPEDEIPTIAEARVMMDNREITAEDYVANIRENNRRNDTEGPISRLRRFGEWVIGRIQG